MRREHLTPNRDRVCVYVSRRWQWLIVAWYALRGYRVRCTGYSLARGSGRLGDVANHYEPNVTFDRRGWVGSNDD